jgi:monoamine oxidase
VIRDLDDLRREMGEATWQAVKDFQEQARALISPASYYESDWREDKEDSLTRRSFHDMLEGVPDEAAREYIRVMAHSDLACEPHQTSASYGLQNHLMDEPDYMQIYSIDGGNERLTQELARRISADILLNQSVIRVELSPEDDYLVTSRGDAGLETEAFDYVIVALPNDWISAITWAGEGLGDAMARHHQFYDRPAHYLRVTALFDRPFWRGHIGGSFFVSDAFGGCCVYDESSRFDSGGKGVLAWLLAGEAALRMANLDKEKIVALVLESLPPVLEPGAAQCLEASVDRWLGSVNALPGGFPARDPDARHLPDPLDHPGLFVMGDYLFDATINGVLDSADTVVEWIIEDCLEEIAMADKGSLSAV